MNYVHNKHISGNIPNKSNTDISEDGQVNKSGF